MSNKPILFLLTILFCLVVLSGCQEIGDIVINMGSSAATPEYAATPVRIYSTPLPEFEHMQFAWFYKPPGNSSDLSALAENFSLVILTRNDEREREDMRAMGYDYQVIQYLRAEAIMNPGSCSEKPFQNQTANLEGDYCQIEDQHPEWFLKDINGNPVQYNQSEYVFMDPGNQDWQDFYLERVKGFQSDQGWQGVFLDNVDGSLGRFEKMRLLLEEYPDDQSYQNAMMAFLQNLNDNYFSITDNVLFANIPYLKESEVWFDYLEFLDGAMLEAFAADWDRRYLRSEDWLAQLELAEKTQALGKSIILVTQGNRDDIDRMQFGLASFLLINNGQAYFRYSNADAYRDLWWYDQYDLELGQPLGPKYPDGEVWQRDFEHGTVRVDPGKHSSEILIY